MGPPVLVQDIIDTIIDSVDRYDLDTFLQCSLVATNWVYRSQSNLFKTIEWRGRGYNSRFSKWLQAVGPRRDDLLSHTLHLLLFDLQPTQGRHLWLCKFPRLIEFQSIARLPLPDDQFLTFMRFNVGRSLRTLVLHETCIRRGTLIGIICTFPLLDYFYLRGIRIPDPDCEVDCLAPPPPLSGELFLCDYHGHPPIVAQLSILPFRFTEIRIKVRNEVFDRSGVGNLIEQSSQTLRSFTILVDGPCTSVVFLQEIFALLTLYVLPLSNIARFEITGISFSSCRELRELRISIYNFSRPQEPLPVELLSTIDSPNFAKLIFAVEQPAGYGLYDGGLIINKSMWDEYDLQLWSWMEILPGVGGSREGLELLLELPLGYGPKRSEGDFAARMPDEFLRRVRTRAKVSFIIVRNPHVFT